MSKRKLKKPVKNFLIWTRRLICLIILLGIGLTVYGLIEPEDNGATPIVGGYQLIKESSRSAYIQHTTDSGDKETVIPSIVISYSVSDNFIAARQTEVPESADTKPDFTTFTYWLINTKTADCQARLSTEEFAAACTEHNLSFNEWLGT